MLDAKTCATRTASNEAHSSRSAVRSPQTPLPDWAVLGARIQEAAMTRAIAAALGDTARRQAEESMS